MKIVIKIGGAALEDKVTLQKCAQAVVQLSQDGHQVAVVHGGGSALTRTLKLLGKESDFVNGLRVTDAETMATLATKKPFASKACLIGFSKYLIEFGCVSGSDLRAIAILTPVRITSVE